MVIRQIRPTRLFIATFLKLNVIIIFFGRLVYLIDLSFILDTPLPVLCQILPQFRHQLAQLEFLCVTLGWLDHGDFLLKSLRVSDLGIFRCSNRANLTFHCIIISCLLFIKSIKLHLDLNLYLLSYRVNNLGRVLTRLPNSANFLGSRVPTFLTLVIVSRNFSTSCGLDL